MFLRNQVQEIEKQLQSIKYPSIANNLYLPVSYMLLLGGKRIRPAFTLVACEMMGGDTAKAIHAAIAIEIFHNFTLLHDDLMDQSLMRRGNPTVHTKWNDNQAILSGDAMQIIAYQTLTKSEDCYLRPLLDLFSKTAAEVCQGQQLDMEYEGKDDVTKEEYLQMINLKTAVLLAASLKLGAIVANASESDADNLYFFGQNLGLAFQLKDDLLDVYGDTESFGKNIGGDIVNNKKTYLLLDAMERATPKQKVELMAIMDSKKILPTEKIKKITSIYDDLHVKEVCENLVQAYSEKAMRHLNAINVNSPIKKELFQYAEELVSRNY